MARIFFEGNTYAPDDGETVLDTLLRHGQDIPNGCRAGACQSCLLQLDKPGNPLPAAAQAGLKHSQKEQGCFLSCSIKPQQDMNIIRAGPVTQKASARILAKNWLHPDVLQITLSKPFACQAGQFINIWLDEHTIRSYSNAAASSADHIQLHVKIIPDGRFSGRASELNTGDLLTVQGSLGDCVYAAAEENEPLLLAGTGTGLAPLIGVIHDALHANHQGDIYLYLAAREAGSFYLKDDLVRLAQNFSHFHVHFVAQDAAGMPWVEEGDIYKVIATQHPKMQGYRVYLCGAQTFVQKLKKRCFLFGAAMQSIHADAFVPFA